MAGIQTRAVTFNPGQNTFVPSLLQDGLNVIRDLTKIPIFNTPNTCNFITECPKPINPFSGDPNLNPNPTFIKPVIENGMASIIPNIPRTPPPPAVNCHKFYSLSQQLNLPPRSYDIQNLVDLSKTMIAVQGDFKINPLSQKSSSLPALFTYLGQFLDHDISLVDVPDFSQPIDVSKLYNQRCALFDLDSVFDAPAVYDSDGYLVLKINSNGVLDVPRTPDGIQIMADIRNGENQIICQVQILFYKFYNRVLRDMKVKNPNRTIAENVAESKNVTRYVWQWIMVHTFLKMACGSYFSSLFLENGEPDFKIITPNKLGALNAEFSFAYYRWHSLPQEAYYANGNAPVDEHPILSLFINPNFDGFKPLEKPIVIDFGFFWPMSGYNGFQQTHRFGTAVSFPLGNLPDPIVEDAVISLPERSLRRQNQTFFANGQDFAQAFGIAEKQIIRNFKLQDENFTYNCTLPTSRVGELENYFQNNMPLFYYILYEARTIGNGEHLGPLGAKLFGLTALAQLYSDPNAYLYKNWIPIKGEWGCQNTYTYTMEDFIRYATENPYPIVPIFSPNLFTNFFNPEENTATQESVNANFLAWNAKIKCTLGPDDAGKKLLLINDLRNSLSNITIQVYNNTQRKLIETLTMDFEDKYAELIWDGTKYVIGTVSVNDVNPKY